MSLSLVAAVSSNQCIGVQGRLPWDLPDDMKHFKEVTMGKTVLMGRKTWESIPEKFRPLPGRNNIVITRQDMYPVPDEVEVSHSLDAVLRAHQSDDLICIGGGELYRQVMEKAEKLFITHVDQVVEACDAFFPKIDPTVWKETEREDHAGFSFVTYERI